MNICIITSSFPSHAHDLVQAPFLLPFIEGLKERKHRVFVFTQDRRGMKEEFLEGVQVKWFPWMKSEGSLAQLKPYHPLDGLRIASLLMNGRRALVSFVHERRIELCFALWVLPGGYFANVAHRRMGIPYSVWALGSDIYRLGRNPLLHPVMKRILLQARGVYADGFDLANRIEQDYQRKCHFLATTRRLLGTKRERERQPSSDFRFLFVGRLERVKGIDILLRSVLLLTQGGLDMHLTIAGRGEMENWAKGFVKDHGLERWVTLAGNVDDNALARLYESSDCVVIPSRSESIPLVFSEALRFDKPMIVTDVGDMGMLGRKYDVAGVVPPQDSIALKEEMRRSVEFKDTPLTEEKTQKREELKRLFDIETSVERFLADFS